MPKTLTIELPDEVYELLERFATDEGRTPSEVGADWIAAMASKIVEDPLEKWIGAIEIPPCADRHNELISKSILKEIRGEENNA
ncbi:MAG: hypothetical protein N3B10_13485 [Armatimonadetes bacterium]|nr:hypothetical protein [Armatimonadota bacterium]MCX7969481.1 hypothetical protein [Armatimonadota bacterium]MDW8141990.1 hypothetical protein [Armatimonadota bacterium]